MRLPFDWSRHELVPEDTIWFEPFFTPIIIELFGCEDVHWVPGDDASGTEVPDRYAAGVSKAMESLRPAVDAESPILYLPLSRADKFYAMAVLLGGDPSLFERPIGWLQERANLAIQEFERLKHWSVDPNTGLLNGRHFYESLGFALAGLKKDSGPGKDTFSPASGSEEAVCQPGVTLFLLEMFPRVRESRQAMLYISRAGGILNTVVGHFAPAHHLGSGIFGLIITAIDNEQAMKLGNMLLDWLKQEHILSVRIGMVTVWGGDQPRKEITAQELLEQAWEALEKARQRGAYSLCAYAAPDSADLFSLKALPGGVISQLKQLWQTVPEFALVLLHADEVPKAENISQRLLAVIGPESPAFQVNDHEVYVLLPGADGARARQWVQEFREKRALDDTSFSAGIAIYPCLEYDKTDLLVNARKAIIHTGFFGPGTESIFDAVSLNISGDVYYNDGYLNKAVREYRQGLALDPANVNLLNSLGVAYAQMNRRSSAIPLFEKVLAIDKGNFMALANLGFALMATGENEKAIECFEKTVEVDDSHFNLVLQLGRLYCQTGRYADVITVLGKVEGLADDKNIDLGHGAAYRYLGEAYKETGDAGKAMKSLQRALRYNPRDGAALSLLGELYALEGEGQEIGLSLCRQAVDLDDSLWQHWYRLGKVQFRMGHKLAAIVSLKESLRRDQQNVNAAFLLARVYDDLGKDRHARRMYERVLRVVPAHKGAGEALAAISSNR